MSGHTFTPFLTLATGYEHKVVSLTSMTKTFNIAGIKGSMIFAKDDALLQKISQQQQLNDEYELNLFAYTAMRHAYEQGGERATILLNFTHKWRINRIVDQYRIPDLGKDVHHQR